MKYEKEAQAGVIKDKYASWLDDNAVAIFYAAVPLFFVSFLFHETAGGHILGTYLSVLCLAVSFCVLLSPIIGNIIRED